MKNKPRRLLNQYDVDVRTQPKLSFQLAEDFKEYWNRDNGAERIMKIEMTEYYFFKLYDLIRNLEQGP